MQIFTTFLNLYVSFFKKKIFKHLIFIFLIAISLFVTTKFSANYVKEHNSVKINKNFSLEKFHPNSNFKLTWDFNSCKIEPNSLIFSLSPNNIVLSLDQNKNIILSINKKNYTCGNVKEKLDNFNGEYEFILNYTPNNISTQIIDTSLLLKGQRQNKTIHLKKGSPPQFIDISINNANIVISKLNNWQHFYNLNLVLSHIFEAITLGTILSILIYVINYHTNNTNSIVKWQKNTISKTFIVSILTSVILAFIWSFYTPSIPQIDLTNYIIPSNLLVPEPKEQFLCLFTIFCIPLLLLVIFLLKKYFTKWPVEINLICQGTIIATLLLHTKLDIFQNNNNLIMPLWLFSIIIFIYCCTKYFLRNKLKIVETIITLIIIIHYLFAIIKRMLFIELDFFDTHHYSVILHSLWQSYHGFQPLAEHGTTYGMYAFFVTPILKLLNISIFSCDVIFCSLILVCILLVGIITYNCCKKFYISLLSVASFTGLFFIYGNPIYYPQYLPLRTLFPLLLLFITSKLNYKSNNYNHYLFIGAILSLWSIIWNPDSGIICFVGFGIYIFYSLFFIPLKERKITVLIYILGIITSYITFALLYKLSFNAFPQLHNLFNTIVIFGKIGFLQLPMPYLGAWVILIIFYLLALSYAINSCISKQKYNFNSPKRVLVLATLLGCGLFLYYSGRSAGSNLISSSWPIIFILLFFPYRKGAFKFLTTFMLIFITFWGVNRKELFFKPTQVRILYSQKMQRLAQVISNNLPTNKKVTLTVHQEAYLAILANAKPAFQHAALEEMFHKNELDSYVNQLNNPLEPMLWVIDTGYLIKHAPLVLKQRLLPIIESKIQRKIPKNTLLCIPLNRNK